MATFTLKIPEGPTLCEQCPLADCIFCEDNSLIEGLDCNKYDLSEIEIIKIEE